MVHEWALAEGIVLYAHSRGERRIKRLVVKLGVLQSIDKEILVFAIRELCKERGLEVESVEVIDEGLLLKCNACGHTWTIELTEVDEPVREAMHFLPEAIYAYFRCPRCKSIDFDIVRGRGLSEILVETYA